MLRDLETLSQMVRQSERESMLRFDFSLRLRTLLRRTAAIPPEEFSDELATAVTELAAMLAQRDVQHLDAQFETLKQMGSLVDRIALTIHGDSAGGN